MATNYFCEEDWERLHEERVISVFSSVNEPPPPPEEAYGELFRAARVLFAERAGEGERIIPPLAFANRASALPELKTLRDQFAKIEDSGTPLEQFSVDFYQRLEGQYPSPFQTTF